MVTDRRATWAGARQILDKTKFTDELLQYWFNFSIQVSEPANVMWKLKNDIGNDTKYRTIFQANVESSDWLDFNLGGRHIISKLIYHYFSFQ